MITGAGAVITVLGFFLTTSGACIGMVGTLQMARAYHPFTLMDFVGHVLRVGWRVLFFDIETARRIVAAVSEMSLVNKENRELSLIGLYLVFCGFGLQLAGGVLALAAFFLNASK
jgi:hypothetical protein